jgi:Protein of unknown function (DUF1064)
VTPAQQLAALRGEIAKGRPRKYHNTPVTVDGLNFDSIRESHRWAELKLLEQGGLIGRLQRQVKYPLHAGTKVIGHIIPDFVYYEDDEIVVEDVKSKATITQLFRWKAKHFLAEYGIRIKVVM